MQDYYENHYQSDELEMFRSSVTGVPVKFSDKGFNNFYPRNKWEENMKQDLIDFCRDREEKRSLLLMGNYGTGKTHLAIAVIRNLPPVKRKLMASRTEYRIVEREIWEPNRALFLMADELFQQLNDVSIARKSKLNMMMMYLNGYDIIVLDDLQLDHLTDAKSENLYLFVNRAYVNMKRLIITTNITMEQLEEKEPRVASRLSEMAAVLMFNGADFRKERK